MCFADLEIGQEKCCVDDCNTSPRQSAGHISQTKVLAIASRPRTREHVSNTWSYKIHSQGTFHGSFPNWIGSWRVRNHDLRP